MRSTTRRTAESNRSSTNFSGVEVWRGGLGGAYLLPALSSAGASLAPPCFRFHTPLVEPDVRICRIRLSEKTHAIAKSQLHVTLSATSENKSGVARLVAILPFPRRFLRPPSTEAPSLPRPYPASSVLRASPPSQSARPISHEPPVDLRSPLGLPVLCMVPFACMPSPIPRQD